MYIYIYKYKYICKLYLNKAVENSLQNYVSTLSPEPHHLGPYYVLDMMYPLSRGCLKAWCPSGGVIER
jgi:hypothetical protein